MWIRLEDDFFDHPKVKPLTGPAKLLHIERMCACGRWQTDGRVSASSIRGKRQEGLADSLARAGVWHRAKDVRTVCPECWKMIDGKPGDGWVIHDFLKYNFSKTEIERRRALARTRNTRWETRQKQAGDASETLAVVDLSGPDDIRPDGMRPVVPQTTPEEARRQEIEGWLK